MEDTTSSLKALIHHRARIQAKLCVEWLRRAQQRSQVKAEVPVAVACFRCLTILQPHGKNKNKCNYVYIYIYIIYVRLIIYPFVECLGSIRSIDRKYIYGLHIYIYSYLCI